MEFFAHVLWAHCHLNSANTCTTIGTSSNAITITPAHTLLAFESHLGRKHQSARPTSGAYSEPSKHSDVGLFYLRFIAQALNYA